MFNEPIRATSEHPALLLDSGAFTAWNTGRAVHFDRYMAYVETVKEHLFSAINLDVIPGSRRRRPTHNEVMDASVLSYRRWHKLRETGVLIMPVFHQNDNPRWLCEYLEDGATFIGISPSDAMPDASRKRWLLEVHDELDRQGVALNRSVFTHVLGLFSPPAMKSLKGMAWSADASTIMRHAVYFSLMVPFTDGAITTSGPFDLYRVVYVGGKDDVTRDKAIAAAQVWDYLSALGYGDEAEQRGDRVVISNVHIIAAANLKLAHRLNAMSAVRCFLAGPDARVLAQTVGEENYPYVLRTYADIAETSGTTIQKFYNRQVT